MSRKKYVLLLLGVFTICAALLVPMFGKPGLTVIPFDGPPSAQQPKVVDGSKKNTVTLRAAVSMQASEYQYWIESNEKFQHVHPAIKVELINFPTAEAYDTWKEDSQIGDPFDIMLLDNNRVREFAVQGYLLPTDGIFTGDSLADQLEALTDLLKWNGSLWGVPLDCNPLLVVWQRELLKTAGLNASPKDWSTFKTAWNGLQSANPNLKWFNILPAEPSQIIAWLGAFKDNSQSAVNLLPFNEGSKQQLRFAADYAKQMSALNPVLDSAKLMQQFESGTLLSSVLPWSVYQSLSDAERKRLTIGNQTGPISWSGGNSFVLSSKLEDLDAARLWINEMTSTSSQLDRYSRFMRLPARISAYTNEFETSEISENPPNWLINMLESQPLLPDPYWSERWNKWLELWKNRHDWSSFTTEQAGALVKQWNGEQESGGTAPPLSSKGNGKLNN
ncbi:extracellular solute-binding protein [Paenibacillus solisilvae]|uniref:Extracellular solute-binding protein n=1 Tax=Paenibacillus solisilvae TaxID=2486751 RepID=A0ABW0W3U9_9BACL